MPCIKVEQRFFPLGQDLMKTSKLVVVRAEVVASDTRDPQLGSQYWQSFQMPVCPSIAYGRTDENKEKDAGISPKNI